MSDKFAAHFPTVIVAYKINRVPICILYTPAQGALIEGTISAQLYNITLKKMRKKLLFHALDPKRVLQQNELDEKSEYNPTHSYAKSSSHSILRSMWYDLSRMKKEGEKLDLQFPRHGSKIYHHYSRSSQQKTNKRIGTTRVKKLIPGLDKRLTSRPYEKLQAVDDLRVEVSHHSIKWVGTVLDIIIGIKIGSWGRITRAKNRSFYTSLSQLGSQ